MAEPEKVAGPAEEVRAGHVPVPVGHRAARRPPAGLHRHRRLRPLQADDRHNVLHALGYDAFGLPAEQYAVQTGQHPRITTEANIATMRAQLRRLGLAHDRRRSVATTDPEFYRWTQWIFLQIFNGWYDEEAGRARPIAELAPLLASGARPVPTGVPGVGRRRPVGRPGRRGAAPRGRRAPAGLPVELAGQLVPRPGHRAGQRGGHRRGSQRPRQLPGVQARPAAVDDADHRVRAPAADRPGRAGLAGVDQAAAAQLDRPVRGRPGHRSPARAAAMEVFTTRPDTLFGATFMVVAPEHPLVDLLASGAWPADVPAVVDRWRRDAARRRRGLPPVGGAAHRPRAADRGPREDRRVHRRLRHQPGQRRGASRSSSPTTC